MSEIMSEIKIGKLSTYRNNYRHYRLKYNKNNIYI